MQQYKYKNQRIKPIGIRLTVLYLLNVTDLFFTKILIATGSFVEANPILSPFISGYISTLLKLGLAALLLAWLYFRLQTAKPGQMRIATLLINLCLGLYIIVNISHLLWLSTL